MKQTFFTANSKLNSNFTITLAIVVFVAFCARPGQPQLHQIPRTPFGFIHPISFCQTNKLNLRLETDSAFPTICSVSSVLLRIKKQSHSQWFLNPVVAATSTDSVMLSSLNRPAWLPECQLKGLYESGFVSLLIGVKGVMQDIYVYCAIYNLSGYLPPLDVGSFNHIIEFILGINEGIAVFRHIFCPLSLCFCLLFYFRCEKYLYLCHVWGLLFVRKIFSYK